MPSVWKNICCANFGQSDYKVYVNDHRPWRHGLRPKMLLVDTKDLMIGDPDDPYFARKLIDEYFTVIDQITYPDILKRHEQSYS